MTLALDHFAAFVSDTLEVCADTLVRDHIPHLAPFQVGQAVRLEVALRQCAKLARQLAQDDEPPTRPAA